MYLHIGNSYIVPSKEIIMILDKETSFKSIDTKTYFLDKSIIDISESAAEIKTYIITERNGKEIIYSTNIKSSTLLKRFYYKFPGK